MAQDVIIASNGAHIDPVTRRFVAGGKPVTAIDSPSMGRELVQRRIEKKRQAIIDAANRLAAEGGALSGTQYCGDLAFVGHVAEAQFVKATNPDDPKSTDAARFLLTEAGLAEAKQTEQTQAQQGDTLAALYAMGAGAADAVLAWLAANSAARVQAADVVDAVSEAVE